MKIQLKYYFFIVILLFTCKISFSQENFASNISKSISDDGKLFITYDIAPDKGAMSFSVILLLTYEGKQVNAESAYGDIGSNIKPGKEKAIVWYYQDDFKGNIENVAIDVFAYKENEPLAVFQIVSMSNNGYAPCEVTFLNNSSYANEYQWNFGDTSSGAGNVSFVKDPSHIYQDGGIYSIALTARNTQLNLDNTYYQSIEIKTHDPTIAGFNIKGNNQMPTAKVDFENTSVNADVYSWDFGDPSSGRKNKSDKDSPTHKYKQSGTFTVELIVKNNFSGLTDKITKDVVVGEEKSARAGFIYTKSSETAPSTVVFKNTSVDASKYEWNFGDPDSGNKNSSEDENPAHIYTKPGSYKVELSAWAEGEKKPDKYSGIITINELPKPPYAAFSIQNNNVLGPATIIFQNKSVNAEEYRWDFGDPDSGEDNISTKMNPVHTYQKSGSYKVVLTASSEGFTKESTAADYIIIEGATKAEVKPVARFEVDSDNITAPASVTFKNSSTDADSWEWNFGEPGSENNTSDEADPIHYYSKAGTYNVLLKATNKSSGLSDISTRTITITAPAIAPAADFSITNNRSTAPAKVLFTNNSGNADSYLWNFGDNASGNLNTSTEKNPQHLFRKAGSYTVILKVTNSESGKSDATKKTVIVEKPPEPPVAGFEISLDNNYVPVSVEFNNNSTNADTYKWNFGDFDSDNNESSEKKPVHYFKVPGTYIITLEAINSQTGESNKVSKEITLMSRFTTFVLSDEFKGGQEAVYSSVHFSDDDFLILAGIPGKGSNIIKLNSKGEISGSKKVDYQAYNIVPLNSGNKFMVAGINSEGKMLVQVLDSRLTTGNPVVFMQNKTYTTSYAAPKIALGRTNEIGLVANTLNDKYPIDIMFQKTDNSGRIIPLADRTFKYVGNKLATDLVDTGDGGFALTGYWQENDNSPMMLLFGKIDRRGHGEMQLISSEMNILGCDIEESYQGGYAVLRAKENVENSEMFEISFILISSDGGPTDCANMLPCTIKKKDIFKYKPSMIKVKDGYVIASHTFNGVDYDITLYWIDKTGNILVKYETLPMEGDQFVMDLLPADDEGFLVSGTQIVNNKKEALIIKTDPFGKLNK